MKMRKPLTPEQQEENRIILQAKEILLRRAGSTYRRIMTTPDACREYWTLHLAQTPHEVFCCAFLDSQNRLLATEELFRGTLAQTSVYPREIVKQALAHNAASVIFCHNHPSGISEPSRADELLTQSLKHALALVDVRVLDHFIVAGASTMSFAERGLL